MHTLLTIIHVLVSVFMILVILLQSGKDAGMGSIGGGGSSSSVFGGRGSQTFLSKVTAACAAIFMITSLSLAYMSSKTESAVLARAKHKAAETTTPASTPAPGATTTQPAAPAPAGPTGTATPENKAAPAPAAGTPAPADKTK